MRKTSWRLYGILTAGVVCAFAFVNVKISFGFLLGALFSALLYHRTVAFCNTVLTNKSAERGMIINRFLGSYALMAIPLVLSAVLPEYFNILACGAGLLLIKVTLVLDSLIERRKKDEHSTSSDNSK